MASFRHGLADGSCLTRKAKTSESAQDFIRMRFQECDQVHFMIDRSRHLVILITVDEYGLIATLSGAIAKADCRTNQAAVK